MCVSVVCRECKSLAFLPVGAAGTDVDVPIGVRIWRFVRTRASLGFRLGVIAGLLASASVASAQVAAGCPAPASGSITSSPQGRPDTTARIADTPSAGAERGAADIILFASIEARSLRFNSQPNAQVRFCWGDGRGDTLRVIERRNLPSPIVSGVTYRDVYVAVQLRAHLNPECLLRGRATSDTTGPATLPPSVVAACAAMSLRAPVRPDSQPRSPPR